MKTPNPDYIRPAPPRGESTGHLRYGHLTLDPEDDEFTLSQRTRLSGVLIGKRMFVFERAISFPATRYYIDIDDNHVEIGAMDGEFAEKAIARHEQSPAGGKNDADPL